EVHCQHLPAQPDHALQVDGERQQHQRGRQQHPAGDRVVELAGAAVDQADAVVDAGDEVAQQQRRHDAVELLPGAGLARGGPEHRTEGGGDQAEQDDVVLDQRGAGGGFAHVFGSVIPAKAGIQLSAEGKTEEPDPGFRRDGGHGHHWPMCCFSQPFTVSCQSTLFCGFSTQWFSSGKYRNLDSTPLRWLAVNSAMPCSTGMRKSCWPWMISIGTLKSLTWFAGLNFW